MSEVFDMATMRLRVKVRTQYVQACERCVREDAARLADSQRKLDEAKTSLDEAHAEMEKLKEQAVDGGVVVSVDWTDGVDQYEVRCSVRFGHPGRNLWNPGKAEPPEADEVEVKEVHLLAGGNVRLTLFPRRWPFLGDSLPIDLERLAVAAAKRQTTRNAEEW